MTGDRPKLDFGFRSDIFRDYVSIDCSARIAGAPRGGFSFLAAAKCYEGLPGRSPGLLVWTRNKQRAVLTPSDFESVSTGISSALGDGWLVALGMFIFKKLSDSRWPGKGAAWLWRLADALAKKKWPVIPNGITSNSKWIKRIIGISARADSKKTHPTPHFVLLGALQKKCLLSGSPE